MDAVVARAARWSSHPLHPARQTTGSSRTQAGGTLVLRDLSLLAAQQTALFDWMSQRRTASGRVRFAARPAGRACAMASFSRPSSSA